jgi:hypothetical protein
MTSTLPRRLAAISVTAVLMTAGVPALAHAAEPHHHPPRAATPPDRVAYVQRANDTSSAVPQRTGAI